MCGVLDGPAAIHWRTRQDGRRYFRPETMALIDGVADPGEVSPALLMAS